MTEPKTFAAIAGEQLAKAYARLGDIADLHVANALGGPYCRECSRVHPCPTYLLAKGVTL